MSPFKPLNIQLLFNDHKGSLGLHWVCGQEFADQRIQKDPEAFAGLVGYMNFIHPVQIAVLGEHEFDYLAKLDVVQYQNAVAELFKTKPRLVILSDKQQATPEMVSLAISYQTPLVRTEHRAQTIIDHLTHYLNNHLASSVVVHGVFMEVFDLGILLSGASGVGKSELALELINRGHRLVADDSPCFTRVSPHTLNGTCPGVLQDFLEVRGLGVINVRAMFGDNAIKNRKKLHLIIRVVEATDDVLLNMDRLNGIHRNQQLLGVNIAEVTVPVAPGRNLAILVEAAVRNQVLKLSGYYASQDFEKRQQKSLEATS